MDDLPGNEIMLRNFTRADKVYISPAAIRICGKESMGGGHGAATVKPDPFTNTLFLLCGRRLDCIREFCRDRDGCILLYKL